MADTKAKPAALAVLDIGKTDVKLLAISPGGEIRSSRQAPNATGTGEPYAHCDVEHIERWLIAALSDLGERFAIQAIIPTAYGSTAALIDDDDLVVPVMDYESPKPAEVAAAYAEVAPWFEECLCPIDPNGLTLGRQLFWQSRVLPEEFARARWILPFAQYWAWRLTGIAASEVTALGARTQLWNPRANDVSSLARSQGWAEKLPPQRKAWAILGPLRPDVAIRTGLPPDTPVLCGIQDSSANLARYVAGGLDDFALISTGTWFITFNPRLPVEALDPLRDMVANTDLEGGPVACARFMGGGEYARIAGEEGLAEEPSVSDVEALIEHGVMALPSFTDRAGPFPGSGGRGRIVGEARSPRARAALACLYVALVASIELDLLRVSGPVVIDGRFAERLPFVQVLAALRPGQPVLVSREHEGTAIGAALLWGWPERREPVPLELDQVETPRIAGLDAYAARWRAAADDLARA